MVVVFMVLAAAHHALQQIQFGVGPSLFFGCDKAFFDVRRRYAQDSPSLQNVMKLLQIKRKKARGQVLHGVADVYFGNRVFRKEIIKLAQLASEIDSRSEDGVDVDESFRFYRAAAQVKPVGFAEQFFGF